MLFFHFALRFFFAKEVSPSAESFVKDSTAIESVKESIALEVTLTRKNELRTLSL